MTPVQRQRRKDQVAEERTKQMAAAAYDRAFRKTQIVLAQQQAQAKPKPSSRKPQNRKPPGKR